MNDQPDRPPPGDAGASAFATTVAAALPAADAAPGAAGTDFAALPSVAHIGRYALKRQLGRGGLGIVWEAWDPLLSRRIAVKTLRFDADTTTREQLDRLFLAEARVVAGLSHPHIVTVHDAGLASQGAYLAMERLHGRDLRQAIAAGWQPTPGQAARLVRRVAEALAYAHGRGVVHCDVKPGNIFLTRDERPVVLDFGIARIVHGAHAAHVTRAGLDDAVVGTPYYLAPEQLAGGDVDARTDVYALGVVLYELLARRKAFDGETIGDILEAVGESDPPPAHEVQPEVPVALSAIAARAMTRDPAQRFADANQMASALRPWLVGAAPRRPRWPGVALASAVGVTVALLAVAGLARWRSASDPAPAPAAAAAPTPLARAAPPMPPSVGTVSPMTSDLDTAATPQPKPRRARKPPPREEVSVAATPPAVAPPPAVGTLRLAITPWGEVEVDGQRRGVTPPLAQIELAAGTHVVTVRNGDFPAHQTRVEISAEQPVVVRHRFGS